MVGLGFWAFEASFGLSSFGLASLWPVFVWQVTSLGQPLGRALAGPGFWAFEASFWSVKFLFGNFFDQFLFGKLRVFVWQVTGLGWPWSVEPKVGPCLGQPKTSKRKMKHQTEI